MTLEDHDASLPTTTVTMATVNFGYNALGQRSAYTSTTTGYPALSYAAHMQYRDGQLAQAVIISGTATGSTTYTDTYVYDQGGNPLELIRARSSGVTDRYWYELDGRGNVVALTDGSGAVVDRYSYDLWGEVKLATEDPTVRQQLRYAGYWYDTKLEWYWLSVRSYEPEGWFIQPDPSMLEGTRSYVYVGDNPIDLQDPTGLTGGGEDQAKGAEETKAFREWKDEELRQEKLYGKGALRKFNFKEFTRAAKAARKISQNAADNRIYKRKPVERTIKGRRVTPVTEYHGRLSDARVRDILSNPDRVYISEGQERNLIFWKYPGDVVVTEGLSTRQGQLITSFGPSGPRGTSGVKALGGGKPEDPGNPITPESL